MPSRVERGMIRSSAKAETLKWTTLRARHHGPRSLNGFPDRIPRKPWMFAESRCDMRIVFLSTEVATEVVCELGLGDELVGVTHECDYPAFVTGLRVNTDAHSARRDKAVRSTPWSATARKHRGACTPSTCPPWSSCNQTCSLLRLVRRCAVAEVTAPGSTEGDYSAEFPM